MSSFSKSALRSLAALSLASLTAVLTGCGAGTTSAVTPNALTNLSGIAHGGPQGDAQATVTLWATTTAAYGTGGAQLAQTTTDNAGFFNFGNTAAVCPTGQQAYITVTGGNPGLAQTASNPQILLMAALGDCANISTNTSIYINELTTVAAGYALSNFMSVDNLGVHVSAPSTNNAQTGTCTVNTTTGLSTCTAAGLRHAFMNALNLVNSVSPTGATSPNGQAYTTVPGNTSSTVPTLLINTLGNILMSCVNSAGGVAGDGITACGKLFSATTPPVTSTVTPITPTNTLQAVMNIAKYPTLTPANLTAAFALQSGFVFYTPNLAAVPSDFSLAIAYAGPVSGTNYQYGFYTVTDINDTTYTFAQTASSGAGNTRVDAMNPYGGTSYQGAIIPAIGCAAGSPCEAGVDTLGHIWLANSTSASVSNVFEINTADGSLTTVVPPVVNPYQLGSGTVANSAAVDIYNNVYVTSANVTAANLFMKAPTDTAFTPFATETVATPEYITVASDGSIWNANYNTTAVNATYIQNTSTTSTPAFGTPLPVTGGATSSAYGISFDSTGNAWVNGLTTLYSFIPGSATAAAAYPISGIGGAGTGTTKNATSARFHAQDGDGNIFLPDNSANAIFQYFPGTQKFVYLIPCTGNTGTACITTGQRVAASRNAEVDSTGSIWVSNPSATVANGNIVQVIGTAAPAWGQRSYQKIGLRP